MRLLHLVPKKIHDEKMSRDRFQQTAAIARQVFVHTSGPGWPDWADAHDAASNAARLAQDHGVDLILVYAVFLDARLTLPVCVSIKEGFERQKVQEVITRAHATLVIFNHENVLDEWQDYATPGRMLAHIPHCADPALYPDPLPTFAQRDVDVMVVGNMNASYYPHRVRLRDLAWRVLRKRGYRVEILKHPGYTLPAPPGTYAGAEYAAQLARAKVVLSCSGHQRAAFLKYVEGPMAGAVFGADLPMDRPFLTRTTLELPLHATDRVILDRIESVLDDEDAWRAIAKPAHELVRKYRTMAMYAEMFSRVCQQFFSDAPGTSRIWRPEKER